MRGRKNTRLRNVITLALCLFAAVPLLYARGGRASGEETEIPADGNEWQLSWAVPPERKIIINPVIALGYLIALFAALGIFFISRGILARRSHAGPRHPQKQFPGFYPEQKRAADLELSDAVASELADAREIQKKFLPLDTDGDGNILNSGYKETKNAVFFGCYEGANEMSGDYFDYLDLDGRYYAIIKCDIAGKGIPASLLMIQVATMFLNYFHRWKPDAKGIHIEELVYQINGFIEKRGFKGRFAAFTLCLFDSQSGALHFCNAGDNIIHILDSAEVYAKSIILPETPAAGILSNDMVRSKGGYHVQTITLNRGDILLLYTDGIKESKRFFHDSKFRQMSEEMGTERINGILNAVMNKGIYTLRKSHTPEWDVDLQFDFSGCGNGVDEVIMALIAVEKIFRCYRACVTPKDRRASKEGGVIVYKKIDAFLKSHFLQYRHYCVPSHECLVNTACLCYPNLREDEQYDDLSILGIKRK
jgi:serine phosphatase RsbU (regulator of sigma subunit)